MIIEKITGMRLDVFCRNHIYRAIGLRNTSFGPIRTKNIAATEFGNNYEKKTAAQYGKNKKLKWRNYVIRGEVHDGNSYYAFRGVAGNAGLFSNAPDLARLLRGFLNNKLLRQKTMKMMIQDQTGGKDKRSHGWVMDPYPRIVSARTFSHTGFTGTMCLVDPKQDIIIILLTNVVHPVVHENIMIPIRKRVVEIVFGSKNVPCSE